MVFDDVKNREAKGEKLFASLFCGEFHAGKIGKSNAKDAIE